MTTWTTTSGTNHNTAYYQLEPPPGFGLSPFGDPSTPRGIAIHGRGFGSPITRYTTLSGNAVSYTPITGNATTWTGASAPSTTWTPV